MIGKLYILSAHWKEVDFINIQHKYIKENIDMPYELWSTMDGFPESVFNDYKSKFDYCEKSRCRKGPHTFHSEKINLLASKVLEVAKDNDILLFIDSDAFPLQPVKNYITEKLKEYDLCAVQRLENLGDIQPHPCFCFTTVGLWKQIKGDWNAGYKWIDSRKQERTDVGGNLLKQLNDNNVKWFKMIRNNVYNPHALFFGIYDSIVYHHGAGSRQKFTKYDKNNVETSDRTKQSVIQENTKLSNNIINEIKTNFKFYERFL
jgi:hypothetical protein